jgi:soluble lytic murein transglycosylase-like protein
MRNTTRGAAAALAICLASFTAAHATEQSFVNDETDVRAVIVRDAEIKREKAAAEAGETGQSAGAPGGAKARTQKTADGSAKRSRASRVAAAPAGSDGLKAIVAKHAAANGVPFSLADAVVRVESRYNPRAANAGNFGLMQIRHQTARGVGYTGSASGLLDAETNARYAMKYLAQAYRLADGDTCRTVMKYQSGHMATRMNGANRSYCAKVRTITAAN